MCVFFRNFACANDNAQRPKHKNMKKKIFTLLTGLLLSGMLLNAQDNPYSAYVRVVQDTFMTKQAMNAEGKLVDHSGSYRAGIQQCVMAYVVYKNLMPTPWVLPDTNQYPIYREIHIYDKQQTPVTEVRHHPNLSRQVVSIIQSARYSQYGESGGDYTHAFDLERGGEYYVHLEFSAANADRTEEITFNDYPSIRTFDNREKTDVGYPIYYQARYNTGYPYDPNSYIDNLYAKLTLTDTAFVHLDSAQTALTFKTHPLYKKAVIDTLTLRHQALPPGQYYIIHETNWQMNATSQLKDTMRMVVNDTLRATASLGKTNLQNDESAALSIMLDYGYPYITTRDSITKKPYLEIRYNITDTIRGADEMGSYVIKTDMLQDSKVVLSHDSLADHKLHYEDVLPIAMTAIPDSCMNKTLYMNVTVYFNNYEYFKKTLPFTIQAQVTALPSTLMEQGEPMYYDMLGRPVGTHPTAPGVYVTRGKKIIKTTNQ